MTPRLILVCVDLDITPQKLTQLAPAVLNMHKAFRPRFTAYF